MTGFEWIGVVGAGMMGSEIALMFALWRRSTLLSDQSRDASKRAIERLHGVLDRGLPRGFWSAEAAQTARPHLSAVENLEGHADRDFFTAAVFEDEALKREVFKRVDAILPPNASHASNASSISITTLSPAVAEARRRSFIGRHFFSPVSRRRLDVIPAPDTDPAFVDAVAGAMIAIGKPPIRVKDVVGFAVNRLFHAPVIESIRLVEEGVCTRADIDAVCKLGLGYPIGPFELLDNTQNSLSLSVHEILYQAYRERLLPRPLLRQMVAAGDMRRKAEHGWHRYGRDTKWL